MTMNGRIVSETRNGVRHFHAHDQLGNTIALYDDSGTKTDSYTYWPYGEVRTRTGTTVNPFQFCGAWGYYKDSTGRTYVRARTLRADLTRWVSVDPMWQLTLTAYVYASADPVTLADASGLYAILGLLGGRTQCPDGKCPPNLTPVPRPKPSDCFSSNPSVPELIKELKFVFCQAREMCGGPMPSWCHGVIPKGKYNIGASSYLLTTICCGDCGQCHGYILPGNLWPSTPSCIKLCAFEHEYRHVLDCKAHMQGESDYTSPVTPWSECQAFCNEAACLKKVLSKLLGGFPLEAILPPELANRSALDCGPGRNSEPPKTKQ